MGELETFVDDGHYYTGNKQKGYSECTPDHSADGVVHC
jgi:hypothetical protein